jgi:hypothetical protein
MLYEQLKTSSCGSFAVVFLISRQKIKQAMVWRIQKETVSGRTQRSFFTVLQNVLGVRRAVW